MYIRVVYICVEIEMCVLCRGIREERVCIRDICILYKKSAIL